MVATAIELPFIAPLFTELPFTGTPASTLATAVSDQAPESPSALVVARGLAIRRTALRAAVSWFLSAICTAVVTGKPTIIAPNASPKSLRRRFFMRSHQDNESCRVLNFATIEYHSDSSLVSYLYDARFSHESDFMPDDDFPDDVFDDEDAAFAALNDDDSSSTGDAPSEPEPEPEPEPEETDGPPGNFEFKAGPAPDYSSPEKKKLAKELWERLAKSRPGPDSKDLMFLARFVPLLSGSAAKTLLSKKPTLSELKELIQYVPKARDAAIKAALKLGTDKLDEDDVRFLFTQSKSPEVGKFLLKKYPNDANIGLVERTIDDLEDFVAAIREKEPTKNVLREIDRKL